MKRRRRFAYSFRQKHRNTSAINLLLCTKDKFLNLSNIILSISNLYWLYPILLQSFNLSKSYSFMILITTILLMGIDFWDCKQRVMVITGIINCLIMTVKLHYCSSWLEHYKYWNGNSRSIFYCVWYFYCNLYIQFTVFTPIT